MYNKIFYVIFHVSESGAHITKSAITMSCLNDNVDTLWVQNDNVATSIVTQ
jgi:hypothetical protein